MNNDYTDITVVLDRSGSMSATRFDAEGGFNTFVTEQAKLAGKCALSLYQFDDHYNIVYEGKLIKEVPKLELVPRGMTALLDAFGKTIVKTGERLSALPEHERPAKVIFMVITDGCENASREYTQEKIKELVEHQRNKYNWQFVFIGADLNTFAEAHDLGILVHNTTQYQNNSVGVASMYAGVTRSTNNYRTGKSKTVDLSNNV